VYDNVCGGKWLVICSRGCSTAAMEAAPLVLLANALAANDEI
jgi:hypothetical protein